MSTIRLTAYLKERFPLVNMMLFAIIYLAVFSTTKLAWKFDLVFCLGILATISFFFRLRVMDEIKDFHIDSINYPNRVLQSGGITLPILIRLSTLFAFSELIWSYLHSWTAVAFWFVAFLYSLLMRYEFFVGEWLSKRLVLYAISHMLVMPLVVAWLWFAYRPDATPTLSILMVLSLLGGFVFELARKTHSPEAERPEIVTYSSLLGLPRAVWFILGVLWLSLLCQGVLFWQLEMDWWAYLIAFGCTVWVSMKYRGALRSKAEPAFRKAELATSIYMLASYVVLIFGS